MYVQYLDTDIRGEWIENVNIVLNPTGLDLAGSKGIIVCELPVACILIQKHTVRYNCFWIKMQATGNSQNLRNNIIPILPGQALSIGFNTSKMY